MKLNQQVCSLELAKRLKELGVKQNSVFYHDTKKGRVVYYNFSLAPYYYGDRYVSAFTVAELGEMLPSSVKRYSPNSIPKDYLVRFWKLDYKYCARIGLFSDDMPCIYFGAGTEADVRAKMLIYLLENKLITL